MEVSRSLSRMGYAPAGRQQAQGEGAVGQKRSSSGGRQLELTDAEMRLVKENGQCKDFHKGICPKGQDLPRCRMGLHTGPPMSTLRAPGSQTWVPPPPPAKK